MRADEAPRERSRYRRPMDREIAELERQFAAEDDPGEELVLRLARAYARAGRPEEAWLLYRDCEQQDTELEAMGSSLAEAEAPLLRSLGKGIKATGRPARAVEVGWANEPETFELPSLRFVDTVYVQNPQLTMKLVRGLQTLPELRRLELDSLGPGFHCGHDRRLEPTALEALAALPKLRELELGGLHAPGPRALDPLAAFGDRLRKLSVGVWVGLEDSSFDVLGKLGGLESLELEDARGTDAALDLLPGARLTRLVLASCEGLSEEGLRRLLRRTRLRTLGLRRQESLRGSAWLDDLPETLSAFMANAGEGGSLRELVGTLARLPIGRLGARVEETDDLRVLGRLTELKELSLHGELGPGRLAPLADVIARLDTLEVLGGIGGECLAVVQQRFRGRTLWAKVEAAPSALIESLGDLGLETLHVSARPLTREAAARLERDLRADVEDVTVGGNPASTTFQVRGPDDIVCVPDRPAVSQSLLRLARITLGRADLRADDAWAELEDPQPMLTTLRDAYGLRLNDVAQLGETIQDTVDLVIQHLAEHDPWP